MNNYKIVSEAFDVATRKVVKEWVGMDDAIVIGGKIYNEEMRAKAIRKRFPNADSLAEFLETKCQHSSKAIKYASMLRRSPELYNKVVYKISGRTFGRWFWNIVLSPVTMFYQGINAVRNTVDPQEGSEVVYNRV